MNVKKELQDLDVNMLKVVWINLEWTFILNSRIIQQKSDRLVFNKKFDFKEDVTEEKIVALKKESADWTRAIVSLIMIVRKVWSVEVETVTIGILNYGGKETIAAINQVSKGLLLWLHKWPR